MQLLLDVVLLRLRKDELQHLAPNAAGFVVGTTATVLFIGLTEQRMESTMVIMAAMASAVLTLMFGDVMPAEDATQWTANMERQHTSLVFLFLRLE